MHMKFSLVLHKATRGLTTCLLDGLLVYLDWRESLRLKVIAQKKTKKKHHVAQAQVTSNLLDLDLDLNLSVSC